MTPEEQRIAIAEACGWNVVKCPFIPNRIRHGEMTCFTDEARREWHKTYPSSGNIKRLPDYINDLNAMHEAEKVLTPGPWHTYEYKLERICEHNTSVIHATAAQRAEAFLRTIGKWIDSSKKL